MRYFIVLLCSLWADCFFAQATTELHLRFVPTYHQEPLSLSASQEAVLQIEKLQCYLSNLALYDHGQRVYVEPASFHLLDAADSASLSCHLKLPKALIFSELRFNIGIDSTTHAAGAMGGDLDPMHGMYWTWQTGYINFKLEGRSKDCPARKHKFQFHIGGYQYPYNTLQEVSLPLRKSGTITITIAVDQLLAPIDLKTDYLIMSPNAEAVAFAQRLSTIFAIRDEK